MGAVKVGQECFGVPIRKRGIPRFVGFEGYVFRFDGVFKIVAAVGLARIGRVAVIERRIAVCSALILVTVHHPGVLSSDVIE